MKKVLQITAITLLLLNISGCASTTNSPSDQLQTGKKAFQANDYKTAYQQLYPAALAGQPDAQYAIGYMMYYGKGVAQNQTEGATWIRSAAIHGQPQAEAALKLLTQQGMFDMTQTMPSTATN